MFTKDEKSLEKYIDVHIFLPSFIGEKWIKYLDATIGLVINTHRSKIDPVDISGFNNHLPVLYECLESILDTPRKIKSMCRHLDEKLSTPASTIYFVDLIFLSSIQASSPRLFQWVSNNRAMLVDPNTATHEAWAIQTATTRDEKESRPDRCRKVLSELKYGENEIKLVTQIFFAAKTEQTGSNDSEKEDRRVRKNQYYLNYFLRDDLPRVGTVNGTREFLGMVKDQNTSAEIIFDYLLQDYENNDRQDLREIILNVVKTWIVELEKSDSYRLLVAFGRLAWIITDEGFIYHPKSVASFASWDFLEKKISSSSEFVEYVTKIFSENISHKFYTVLVFYIFTEDQERRRDPFQISADERKLIGDKFNSRCIELFFDKTGKPRNIFDQSISDCPFDILFRWAQVQDTRQQEKYLDSLIREKPEVLKNIIDYMQSQRMDAIEIILPKERWVEFLKNKTYSSVLSLKQLEIAKKISTGDHQNGWEP